MNNCLNIFGGLILRMVLLSIVITIFGEVVFKHEKKLCAKHVYYALIGLTSVCIFPVELILNYLENNDIFAIPQSVFYVSKTIYTCIYIVFDSFGLPKILCLIWGVGVAWASIKEFRKCKDVMRYVERWKIKSEVSNLDVLVKKFCDEYRVRKKIKIIICKGINSPFIMGIKDIKLIMPVDIIQTEDLQYMLRHEIIHIKRKDNSIKVFIRILGILNWYNPLFAKIEKYISLYCEVSCDQEVVSNQSSNYRKKYGDVLLKTVIREVTPNTENVSFINDTTFVSKRIDGIIGKRTKKGRGLQAVLFLLFFISYYFVLQTTKLNPKVIQAYTLSNMNISDDESLLEFAETITSLTYEDYVAYGVVYDEKNEQLYYKNKPVKELVDRDMKVYYCSKKGDYYIDVKRDVKGNIIRLIIT